MTHLFRKELLIQITLWCFVDFCQVFAGNFCFEGGLWGLIVLIPDHSYLFTLTDRPGPEYIPPDKCHLPCLFPRQLSNEPH